MQIRKTLYDNRATIDQYGIPVGTVIDTISAARGMLSAAADSSMNSADEGITTVVVRRFFPGPEAQYACGHTYSSAVSSVFALHA